MPRAAVDTSRDRAFSFTEPKIDALTKAVASGAVAVDADGRRWWRDTECRQLWVRISKAGSATYYRVYKTGGRRHRERIGDAGVMLLKAARIAVDRLRNGDAKHTRQRGKAGTWTIQEAVDAYLQASREGRFKVGKEFPGECTLKSYFDMCRPHLLRPYGSQSLQWLGNNFKRIHKELSRTRKGSASRLRTVVTNVFLYAIEVGEWTTATPMIDPMTGRHTTPPTLSKPRERFLTPEEIAKLERYARACGGPWHSFWMLALYTGVRRGNLRDARWQDIDLDAGLWRIPKTKNGRQHVVELVPEAVAILRDRRRAAARAGIVSPWVFPSAADPSEPMKQTADAWQRLRNAVPELADARTHDLRRTAGTLATIAGVPEAAVGAMLGHAPGSAATKVYARINVQAKRQAYGAAASVISAAIAPKKTRKPR